MSLYGEVGKGCVALCDVLTHGTEDEKSFVSSEYRAHVSVNISIYDRAISKPGLADPNRSSLGPSAENIPYPCRAGDSALFTWFTSRGTVNFS